MIRTTTRIVTRQPDVAGGMAKAKHDGSGTDIPTSHNHDHGGKWNDE